MVAASRKSHLAVGIALTLGFLLIFLLPLNVPVPPGISDAYLTGFNGRAGLCLVGIVLSGFAIWTGGLGLALPERPESRVLGRPILYKTLAITAACTLSIWWLMRSGAPANEAHYFADRYQMYQDGARLYTDIEFPYGPLMFYLPLWVQQGTHLSLTDSYFASWVAQWLAGVWMLWLVVDLVTPQAKYAGSIYLLFWGFSLVAVVSAGPNYTLIRFASTLLAALLVDRLNRSRRSPLPALALACLGFLLLLFYSPEQGIAFGLATVVYFAINASRKDGFLAGILLYFPIATGGLVLADRIGLLSGIKQFSGGGFAFPFVLSVQNVLLLLLLQAAICAVWGTLRRGCFDHPLLYLCLVAAFLTPSALGRSDAGHIVFNLLGALLTGFIVLAPYPALWHWAKYSFLFVIVVMGAVLSLYNGRGLVLNAMSREVAHEQRDNGWVRRFYIYGMTKARGEEKAWRALAAMDGKAESDTHAALAQESGRPGFLLAPFGHAVSSFDRGLGPRVTSGRYAFLFPLLSGRVAEEKTQELRRQPTTPLLLPDNDSPNCGYDEMAERRMLLSVLTPLYLPRFVHHVHVAEPLCTYIQAHYRPSALASPEIGYRVWEPSL